MRTNFRKYIYYSHNESYPITISRGGEVYYGWSELVINDHGFMRL